MDEMTFETWYRTEHARLVSSMAVVCRDPALAAEAVDEAFVRAYERWNRVGLMASPTGWTYRTALNCLRRRQRRAGHEARLFRRAAHQSNDGGCAPPPDWSSEVWDAVSRLPVRERTAIALRYVSDLSTADIAEAMGIASGTVGSTLHAARRNLAAVLGDHTASGSTRTLDLREVSGA